MTKISSNITLQIKKYLPIILMGYFLVSLLLVLLNYNALKTIIIFCFLFCFWLFKIRYCKEVFLCENHLKVDDKTIKFSDLITIEVSYFSKRCKIIYFDNGLVKSFLFQPKIDFFNPYEKPKSVVDLEKIIALNPSIAISITG